MGIKVLGNVIEPGLGDLGSLVSKKALDLFGKITGFGDYAISSNSLISAPMTGGPPLSGPPGIRVRDKEFVKFITVAGQGTFKKLEKFFINPSNPKLFPKLSIKAQLYQQYKLHGMIVYLESTCSESISTSGGNMSIPSIIVATSYNLQEQEFGNESTMLNSYFSCDKRVNKDLIHPIECDRQQMLSDILFTWAKSPVSGFVRDPNLQDIGLLQVAQIGGNQTQPFVAYKMYVEYDVEFFKPIINATIKLEDHYQLTSNVTGDMFSGGKLTTSSTSDSFEQQMYTIALNVITFDASVYGTFEMEYVGYYSISTAATGASYTLGGNASALSIFNGDTTDTCTTFGTGSVPVHVSKIAVTLAGGGTITISDVSAANWSKADVFISSLDVLNN